MNVQLVRICNTNALNISICNAKRTLKEIQKIPQPKASPELRNKLPKFMGAKIYTFSLLITFCNSLRKHAASKPSIWA